ncbi:MAG TPA: HutD family protein [Bradyrhizobium sp.]
MKVIRAVDCRTTPWKNGGGSTTEIAAEPSGASLDTFDWRVSMAKVASDGPFSEFPGIDRTLAVIKGSGLLLTIGSNAPVTVEPGSDPVHFAGDIATSARLIAGEITDLNVMTRRGRFSHRLLRIPESVSCDFDGHNIAVVLPLDSGAAVTSKRDVAALDHGDAAILVRERDTCFRIAPVGTSGCYLVLLREHRAD